MNKEAAVMNCPLCDQPERCGNPEADPGKPCWCYSAGFPKEIFELIPEGQRRKACICPDCLAAFKRGTLPAAKGNL